MGIVEEHDKVFKVLLCPPYPPKFNLASVGCAGPTSLNRCAFTSRLTGLEGSAANVVVSQDTFRGSVESMARWVGAVSQAQHIRQVVMCIACLLLKTNL